MDHNVPKGCDLLSILAEDDYGVEQIMEVVDSQPNAHDAIAALEDVGIDALDTLELCKFAKYCSSCGPMAGECRLGSLFVQTAEIV